MFGRRRRKQQDGTGQGAVRPGGDATTDRPAGAAAPPVDAPAAPPPTPPHGDVPPAAALLAGVLAEHLDGATVVPGTADVTSPAVDVECRVEGIAPFGRGWNASCFLQLTGGRFGTVPVFAQVTGLGPTQEHAVADGAHQFATTLTSLLRAAAEIERDPRAALAGQGTADGDVERLVVDVDGRRHAVVVTGVDRAFGEPGFDPASVRGFRQALGGTPWLLPGVLRDGRLPLLGDDRTTLVSLLLGDTPAGRTVELKVHGCDWPADDVLSVPVAKPAGLVIGLLWELALLVPLDPPVALTRAAVERTLTGLAARPRHPRQAVGWQGWQAHGGVLGPVLGDAELAAVEAGTGPLPDEARWFLTHVAGPGAGPGYGLLPPRRVGDVVPLAHAGCGNAWVLRLDGPDRGTVWMDARASDEGTRKVADSVGAWFTAWLDGAARSVGPWQQYDVTACSSVATMSRMLTTLTQEAAAAGEAAPTSLAGRVADGGMQVTGSGAYLPPGPLDPCHGCVLVASRLGLPPSVFVAGAPTTV